MSQPAPRFVQTFSTMAGDEGELAESGLYQSGPPSPLLPLPLPRMLQLMEAADRQLDIGGPVRGFDERSNRRTAQYRIFQWVVLSWFLLGVIVGASINTAPITNATRYALAFVGALTVVAVLVGRWIWVRGNLIEFVVSDDTLIVRGLHRTARLERSSVREVLTVTHVATRFPLMGLGVRVRGRKRAVRIPGTTIDHSSTIPGTPLHNSPTPTQALLFAWARRHGIPETTRLVPPPPLPDWARPDPSWWFGANGTLVRAKGVGESSVEVGAPFIPDPVIAKLEIISVQMIDESSARVVSLPLSARSLRIGDLVRIGPTTDPLISGQILSVDAPSERGVVQITMYDRNSILEWRPVIANEHVHTVISPMPSVIRLDIANGEALGQTLRALQPWATRQAIHVSVVAYPFDRKP